MPVSFFGNISSSFYFYVTLTVTDTRFVTLTVTHINQQELDTNFRDLTYIDI